MEDGINIGTGEAPGVDDPRAGKPLLLPRPPEVKDVLRVARVSLEVLAIAGIYLFLVVAARDCRLPRTSKIRQREARTAALLAAREEEIHRVSEG